MSKLTKVAILIAISFVQLFVFILIQANIIFLTDVQFELSENPLSGFLISIVTAYVLSSLVTFTLESLARFHKKIIIAHQILFILTVLSVFYYLSNSYWS